MIAIGAQEPPSPWHRSDAVVQADFSALLIDRKSALGVHAGKLPNASWVKGVMFVIVHRLNQGSGQCHPAIVTIAEESGLPRRNVQFALEFLESERVLMVDRGHHSKGVKKKDSTSRYSVSWDRLRQLARPATCLSVIRSETIRRTLCASSGAPCAPVQAHETQDSGAPCAPVQAHPVRTDPVREPRTEPFPPNPPRTSTVAIDRSGGGGKDDRGYGEPEPDTGPDRRTAEAIVDAYPPTPGDAEVLDIAAAVKAIETERAAGSGITGELILAAVKALAANPPREFRWPRKWLEDRCYSKFCRARVRASNAATAGTTETDDAARRRAEVEAAKRRIDAINATLANVGDDGLAALKAEAIEAEASGAIRERLSRADPRTSSWLRELMAARIDARVEAA